MLLGVSIRPSTRAALIGETEGSYAEEPLGCMWGTVWCRASRRVFAGFEYREALIIRIGSWYIIV